MFVYSLQTICKPAPFSTDEEAIVERDATDYNYKITYQMARSGQTKRRVRVYADGVYDLFHQGHARQLMQVSLLYVRVFHIICIRQRSKSKKYFCITRAFVAVIYERVQICSCLSILGNFSFKLNRKIMEYRI